MGNSRVGQYLLEYEIGGFPSPITTHKLRCNIMVVGTPPAGTVPTAIDVNKRGGTTANLQVVADQVWSYFRLLYGITQSASSFTLWNWVTNTAKDFVAAGTLTTPLGATGAFQSMQQTTLTFRSGGGGIAKLVFIEPNQTGESRSPLIPNAAGSAVQRIAAFALSADSPFQALDNGFFVAALRDARGQNEAIRNRRLGVS